jgi:hypothetical protein
VQAIEITMGGEAMLSEELMQQIEDIAGSCVGRFYAKKRARKSKSSRSKNGVPFFVSFCCISASPIAGGGMLIAPPRKKKKKGETKLSTAETLNLMGELCVSL